MRDWFIWKGEPCTVYGIHVSEQPPITIPEERVTFTDVPGRSGSLTILEGQDVYKDLTLTANCFVSNENAVFTFEHWLRGGGTVEFANRPGGHFNARIVNQIPFERIVRGRPNRTFAVNFRCKPFWYKDGIPDIVLTESMSVINNPGNIYSMPVIKVEGSGDSENNGAITIGSQEGSQIILLNSLSSSKPLYIDGALLETYSFNGTIQESANYKMDGEYPMLVPGNNMIIWTEGITKVTISPNWRYLTGGDAF